MLTEADKHIIGRDPALPGLAALLDAEMLLPRLQALPALNTAEKAEIQYLRYKPGNSCACTLRIRMKDGSRRYYYAKALTAERFEESWNRPSRQKLVRAGHLQAPLAVSDLCIMLLHPAHDREIGRLKWLIDEEERKRLFEACSLPSEDNSTLRIDILRYKPERRLVAKISSGGQPLAVIRCAAPDEFAKMLTGCAFGAAQGSVRLLGADGTYRTLATDWQKGQSLCPEEGALPTIGQVRQLARQLARIHQADYHHPTEYTAADEIKSLQGVANTFRHILPEHAAWFDGLAEHVGDALRAVPEHSVLIHGDFSLDQVVLGDGGHEETVLHILDWDRCTCGNPLLDLASFQARLELQVIENILPRWQADEILSAFFDAYKEESQSGLEHLHWFTASAMLRLAAEPFRKRDSQWAQYTLQLLQRTEEISSAGSHLVERPSENPIGTPQDSSLTPLLDVPRMQTLMQQAEILPSNEHILSAELIRHKAGRRALVDYQTDTGRLIGKYRTKGLDKRSLRIQQYLRQHGFDETAKTSVPATTGALPELNTWFQQRINGQSIGNMLMPQNGRLKFLGEAAACALNTLHQSPAAQALELPLWTPENEMEILRSRLTEAQTLLPQHAKRIARILEGCETLAQTLAHAPSVTVHRDFYQDQMLERFGRPGHMVLLDLDLLRQGRAALDAGNYIAHIQEFALRRYGSENALDAHADAFLKQFLEESETADEQEVAVYTTLSLARHIYISTLFENRKHTTEPLLKLCESRLGSHANAQ